MAAEVQLLASSESGGGRAAVCRREEGRHHVVLVLRSRGVSFALVHRCIALSCITHNTYREMSGLLTATSRVLNNYFEIFS